LRHYGTIDFFTFVAIIVKVNSPELSLPYNISVPDGTQYRREGSEQLLTFPETLPYPADRYQDSELLLGRSALSTGHFVLPENSVGLGYAMNEAAGSLVTGNDTWRLFQDLFTGFTESLTEFHSTFNSLPGDLTYREVNFSRDTMRMFLVPPVTMNQDITPEKVIEQILTSIIFQASIDGQSNIVKFAQELL